MQKTISKMLTIIIFINFIHSVSLVHAGGKSRECKYLIPVSERRSGKERWGVIDIENNVIIKLSYDAILSIINKFIFVEKKGKIGVIDKEGRIVIPYVDKHSFYIISLGFYGIIFKDKEGQYIYIRNDGRVLYMGKDAIFTEEPYHEHRIYIIKKENKGYIKAIYDEDMHLILDLEGRKIDSIEIGEDRILFCTKLMGRWDKCGFMDFHGNITVPPIYDRCVPYHEGFATVLFRRMVDSDLDFFINKKGELLWGPFLEVWTAYSEGYAAVYFEVGDDLKCNYINKQGERVFEENFDYCGAFSEGLAHVGIDMEKEDGYTELKRKVDFAYADLIPSSFKFGYINKKGKVVIPFMYEFADAFINGLARVGYKGKTGLINKRNEWVIPPEYSDILYWDIQKSCIENPFAPLLWKKLRDVLLKKD